MNEIEDIRQKRALLLTARLRFLPQIQPTKQAAMDKIVEQILLVADDGKGLSPGEIQSIFSSESGGYTINLTEVRDSINRLVKQERIEEALRKGGKHIYRLSKKALPEIVEIQKEASRRLIAVVNRLFKNAKKKPSTYVTSFLECLSHIFSRLGEEYVRVIKGEVSKEDFLTFPFTSSVLEQIIKKHGIIEPSLFKRAIISFFHKSDPEYDLIKWNMAQNYFLMKALGLDPDILPLFKEMLGNATFYLDTNLIIPALEQEDEYHGSFKALHKACKRLNIKLKVCQISLDELRGWLTTQRDLIEKVKDQIPKELGRKVHSNFYQSYEEKQSSGEIIDIDEVFIDFKSPREDLEKRFQVELEDDRWFDEARSDPETISFSETLRAKYLDIRNRSKTKSAALHDSLLLLWLQKLRKESNGNIWLITADTSLPGSLPQPTNAHLKSLAITQDALLQWISPLGIQEEDEMDFAAIFAEIIKYRLLPQERIFNLEDFLIFHELNMSCKDLPEEDVEGCIQYIRKNVPRLNPLEPADREELASEVSKFFVAPGRKYKLEIERLEAENQRTKQELKSTRLQHRSELERREKRISDLEDEFSKFKKNTKEESLKSSAKSRIRLIIYVFVILEAIVAFLASRYGDGENLFQKILNSWLLWAVAMPAVTTLMGRFFIGKERLKALGWPFTRIFK